MPALLRDPLASLAHLAAKMMAKKKTTRKKSDPAVSADTRILVLHGPEPMIMQERLDTLRDALNDAHGGFETFRFDGKNATLADVFDELRGYSLMSSYKLVQVDDAEEFVKKHREPLERYAQAPVDHATLVLRADKWSKGNLDKHIAKVGAVVKCEPPKPAEAARWLVDRAGQAHGVKLSPSAAGALVDRIGPHLMMLDAELGKLAVMAGDKPIDLALIDEQVGRSSDAKAWLMQEPLLAGMARGSARPPLEMVRELIDLAGNDPVPVTWAAIDLSRKLAVAWAMRASGRPEPEVAKTMRLWGGQVRPFMDVVRKLDASSATALLRTALQSDARTKSGLGTARRNLEALCVTLTDK